jgi:hypothetical protein
MKKIFYLFVALLLSQNVFADNGFDLTPIKWIGGTSDNWATASNWDLGRLPTADDFIYIDAVAQRNVVIYSGTTATISTLIVSSPGRTLTINSGATLKGIGGGSDYRTMNFLEDGGIIINNGTMRIETSAGGTLNYIFLYVNGTGNTVSFTNNGTIDINISEIAFAGTNNTVMNITNNGTINMTDAYAGFNGEKVYITNSGTINYNSTVSGNYLANSTVGTITNNACGKIIGSTGNYSYKTTTNSGLIQISGALQVTSGQTFTNNGVLKYGSISGSVTNTSNGSAIVNINPTNNAIFNYGGTFNGTINGIYKNSTATTSAGTFTAPNSFAPSSLSLGSQTLYAKITPSGGACNYIVPFNYIYDPEMEVKGNNTTINDGDTSPSSGDDTNFGSQSVSSGTIVRTFTINNTGNAPLDLSGSPKVAISGTNASDFTVTSQPSSSVAASTGSTTFEITFDPSGNGTRSASVSIANNDSNENSYNFSIQGTGATPEINIKGNNVSISNGDSGPSTNDHTDFGSLNVLSETVIRTFTILNTGSVTLNLNGTPKVAVTGTNASDFTVTTQPGSTVAATSGTTTFQITFDPSAGGLRTANISIDNDDTDENPYTFTIQGTGSTTCSQVATATELMTWTGMSSTDWSNACNWSPNGVPSATNPVLINSLTNCPIISSGTALAKSVQISGAGGVSLTINNGAMLTVATDIDKVFILLNANLTNHGTLNVSNTNGSNLAYSALMIDGSSILDNYGTISLTSPNNRGLVTASSAIFNNKTGATLTTNANFGIITSGTGALNNETGATINGSGITGAIALVEAQINNYGSISMTGQIACYGTSLFRNYTCATFKNTVDFYNSISSITTNSGYMEIGGDLYIDGSGTFNNSGVLKYRSLVNSATFTNSGASAVRVNNSPTPIFTYGGSYNGTINGIFTDADATISAGTFTPPNTFVPNGNVVAGSQTLYVKITPNGGACSSITPFTYVHCVATASISYSGTPYCKAASPVDVTLTGTTGGTFTSAPAGLTINGSSGQITPSSSTAGTYTVTYTIAASGDCGAVTTTANVTIINNPSASISYTGTPYCKTASAANISLTGSSGGTFTSAPAGLTLNSSSGQITPSNSTAGTYTVTYTIAAAGGCNSATATTAVTITERPTASISYEETPYCKATGASNVTLTGTTGGTFTSSPSGLTINSSSGQINPSSSTARTYTVTYTIAASGGCTIVTNTTSVIIANNPSASITGSTNLTCTTTSVTRTASGGGTYQWSNGLGTNALAAISSAGTYTVTVTGANGCTATATTSVTQNIVTPTASISGSDNLTCATTSVSRTASGGGTYQWSNGLGTNALATISTAGTYTVTVTGANGCTATATTSVTQDGSLPTASITGSANLTCTTTSVTRTASGGVSYQWSNGLGTNALATISSAGTYTVTVTGANGCTATATTSVTQNIVAPTASISGSDNLTCATTSVSRTASGGGTYQWSNGLGTNALANISSVGTYTVTVTGSNGCTATATTSVTQDGSLPTASITGSANLTCATTSVSRTASGGGTYQWSNGLGTNALATISTAGTYTVTVTGTNGCTATATTAVTQDGSLPSASITGSANLTCTTTSVTRTASGGGTYQWSNGLGSNSLATISTVGTYTVTVTGTNGCTATATTSVTQDGSLPSASIAGSANLTCATTSVTRTASGGVSYQWSNGLGTNALATINSAGTYTVTVTGSNGCTATATTSVTQDGSLPSASITGSANLTCTTTSVTRTASGGGTYQWSNGLGTNALATISTAGTYTVTVTGTNGCTATATTTVTRDGTVPAASISGSDNLTCTTTSVTRTASGGGTYQWSNGLGTNALATISTAGTYTVTVTGTNGCTATATTSVTLDGSTPTAGITGSANLTCATTSVSRTASGGGTYQWSNGLGTNALATISSAGTYTVTVTGSNGCTATATTTVTRDGTVPTASITGSANLTCATTSVGRTASGGVSYQWSNGLGTNSLATISSAGTYTVTVTGSNGCTATATTTVTRDGTVPSASITGSANLTCATTSVSRTASGGGTYQWSNGLGTNALATISTAGTYTVTVTGSNGCTATATTSVTQDGSTPTASITGSANLTCATTSVTRTASGGVSYQWSNGLGTNALATISTAGTYTVTVTGANGCTATATTSVTQNIVAPTASISGSDNLTCTTTSVTRTASGGGTYQWSNGLGTNALATISTVGTYTVTVTGANGCTATATTSVTQNLSLTTTASNTGPYNVGQTIQMSASGGDSRTWSGPASFTSSSQNPTIPNALLANAGTYTATVISGICTATATTSVIVSGVDPCTQIVDLQYVKAGDPYQSMFSLKDGMVIQQIPEQVSIIANPICPSIPIGSVDLTITGPEINWTILQNVQPYAVFDNLALNVYGQNFIPGTYTMTVTGYAEENRIGGTVYGPVVTTFTVVGTMAVINAPTIPNNRLCAGSIVDVSFATTGSFSQGNTFNIQLSDTTGGFTNPILIGMASAAGTISCQLPQNLSPGGRYLIRVASSSQVVASNPTIQYLSVIPASKNLTANINTGTITEQVAMQITAYSQIISPANVTYKAGTSIILNPGFTADTGTVFKAEIAGCSN